MDMDMVDMVIMATMERGKPKQLLLLSQDTITMDTVIMEDMDTMDIMEREKLRLAIIMDMDMVMDMVDMVIMDTMEREKLSWLPSWLRTWIWIWWIWSPWIL